jgi:hypothetical protein
MIYVGLNYDDLVNNLSLLFFEQVRSNVDEDSFDEFM